MNRPRYRNAQSTPMLIEMDHAFERANFDLDVRVIALFGAGDHFSAGHDLGTPEETEYRETEYAIQEGVRGRYNHTREQFVDKTLRWRNVQKPTVAAVQGYCIFGGWIVASAMDLIFAAEDAMFHASRPFPGPGPRPAGHGATLEDWMGGTLEEGVFDAATPSGGAAD